MPQLAAVGELIADLGQLPAGWQIGHMTEIQTLFVLHWRRKREREQRRSLGELLGVYWSADTYVRSDAHQHGKRVSEVFIPLASLLVGKPLYDHLDKILDVHAADPEHHGKAANDMDLSTLPLNDWRTLFEQEAKQNEIAADSVVHPASKSSPAPIKEKPTEVTPIKDVQFDLERIRKIDPELARHLDPNESW